MSFDSRSCLIKDQIILGRHSNYVAIMFSSGALSLKFLFFLIKIKESILIIIIFAFYSVFLIFVKIASANLGWKDISPTLFPPLCLYLTSPHSFKFNNYKLTSHRVDKNYYILKNQIFIFKGKNVL